MALSVKIGSFNISTGVTDVVVTGVGFQPKAIIFHWNGSTAAVDTVGRSSIDFGFGFAVSPTDQRGWGSFTADAVAASTGGIRGTATQCIVQTDAAAAADGLASLQSMDVDGFTLNIDASFSRDLRIMYIAFGGTDITNAKTVGWTSPTTTGNFDITTVGFQGNIIFTTMGNHLNGALPVGLGSSIGGYFGAAISATKQRVFSWGDDDGSATTDTASYISDADLVHHHDTAVTTTSAARQQFVSWLSNGFRLNQVSTPQGGTVDHNFALIIQGAQWDIGDLVTQLDTTTTVTETGLAFAPSLVMFASVSKAKSTAGTPTDNAQASFGAATSTTSRVAMALHDVDNLADVVAITAIEYDSIYANISSGAAIQGLMDITAFNSDGFSVIMDDADPSQAYIWWVTVGPTGGAPATKAPPPRSNPLYIWRHS